MKRACGNVLLDEKILGTMHAAVAEDRLLGGTNKPSLHRDLRVEAPTVAVDGTPLLTDGDLVV